MRRYIPLIAVALTLGAAAPATAATADTKVNRHGEIVGSVVHKGAGRFVVENNAYKVQAEVRRQGNRRWNFVNSRGVVFAYVAKSTGRRWNVFATGHSEPIGHVETHGKKKARIYNDEGEEAVGDAAGPASIQGAAAVLVIFD